MAPPIHANLLREFLAGRDEPCPKCGYNLRDATGTVCPECGAPVRLTLERTVMPSMAVRLAVVALLGNLVLRTCYGALALWQLVDRGAQGFWIWQLNAIAHSVATAGWTLAWLTVAFRRHRQGRHESARRCLVLAGLWVLVFDSLLWPVVGFLIGLFGV